MNHMSRVFDLKPICPEVEIGMSVPRNPIHLVMTEGRVHAVEVNDSSKDYSLDLINHAESQQLHDISAYVFKARSPSCGVGTTVVQGSDKQKSGVFAEVITQQYPYLPVIDESILDNDNSRDQFLENIFCYAGYQADESVFIQNYGLRWALRTGNDVNVIKKASSRKLESVFFLAMNKALSVKQRLAHISNAIKSNPSIFSGLEASIFELIDDNSYSAFELTDKILNSVIKNNPEVHCLPISCDESYLRRQNSL